jgi:hypothetical protein
MYIKILYGEVKNNCWYGQDSMLEEVSSIEEARANLLKAIELDHDYPNEWMAEDVEKARKEVNNLQENEGAIRIRGVEASEGETFSVYEYSFVSEVD